MKFGKRTDIVCNIFTPLLLGVMHYWAGASLPSWVRNYLPDGLWAYAFISCILIIWDRKINTAWIVAVFLLAVIYEWLQYLHVLAGTGDIRDILTYFVFFTIALSLNTFFKKVRHIQ